MNETRVLGEMGVSVFGCLGRWESDGTRSFEEKSLEMSLREVTSVGKLYLAAGMFYFLVFQRTLITWAYSAH